MVAGSNPQGVAIFFKFFPCKLFFSSLPLPGLENSTRLLVFTSASGCRASENFDISSENNLFFPYMPIVFVMQGKCLFSDISSPAYYYMHLGKLG